MRLIFFITVVCWVTFDVCWSCPTNFFQWSKKLEVLAGSLVPDLGNNDLYISGPKLLPTKSYQRVLDFWDNCGKKAPFQISKRFQNILRHSSFMVKAQARGHSGFKVSDKEYLLKSYTLNPSFAQLPKVFFQDNYLPKNWEEILKRCQKQKERSKKRRAVCQKIRNWKIIDFHSTLEDGSGHHRRLIFQIPRKNFQQYLLFFPENKNPKHKRLVDIIALQTRDLRSGKSLAKTRLYFFERHSKGFAVDGGRCFSCHPNGLREIYPIQGSVIDRRMQKNIQGFNREVRNFASVDWEGLVDVKALGPPMGGICLNCHQENKNRYPLTIFTKPSLIRSKIHELEMPFPKLYKSYFQLLNGLPEIKDVKLKRRIKNIPLNIKALPHQDYRKEEEIKMIRKQILEKLFHNNKITWWQWKSMEFLEWVLSIYSDYKLKNFFVDYEKLFKNWLLGHP